MTSHGVVFDMDGVIVNSEHLWEEAWVACAAHWGVEWNSRDTATVQGMSAPEWARYLADRLGDESLADTAERECVDYLVDAIHAGRAPLLPGAGRLIFDCAARVPIAVASSAARRVIDTVLDTHGLTDMFAATVSSAEVARGKPSPDVYAAAAASIDLDSGQAIAIEDSGNGIRAAHAAGLTVVAIPNTAYPPGPDALALAGFVATSHAAAWNFIDPRLPKQGEPS